MGNYFLPFLVLNMADGADNTQIGDVTIFDTSYFDQDYKLKPIWLGLLWWLIGTIPMIIFRGGSIGYDCIGYSCISIMSTGEWHGWSVLQYATGSVFGAMGTFWLLAYIKTDSRIMQKIYYRAIAWGIPLSWVLALWAGIALLVGGSQYPHMVSGVTEYNYNDIGYAIGYMVVLAGLEALAYYLAPGNVKFYKWDQQEWWNYNEEDAPDNWPSQLGDFVDY